MSDAIAVVGWEHDPVLLKLGDARQALAHAKSIQGVKQIADLAAAAKVYARQQQLGEESIAYAHAVQIEALRRLGEILKQTDKATGGDAQRTRFRKGTESPPTLREIGLTKKQSFVAQTLAALPARQFDQVREGTTTLHDVTRAQRRAARVIDIVEASHEPVALEALAPAPVIYADPPWEYEHVKTESRAIENQYPTMALEAICALSVGSIATADAVLFLWATSPKLAEAMSVVTAWGFTYRTCLVWVKDQIGMGYYARQQHELLLVATRGELPVPEPANRPASVVYAPRGDHSVKPSAFYDLIERMYPEYAKRELFQRGAPRAGWLEPWGNQSGGPA